MREAIEHDLANVGMMIGLSGACRARARSGAIVRDLEEGIAAELDTSRGQPQQRFSDHFEGHAFIRVPRVFHELTTDTVLVQEYIKGRPFAATADEPGGTNRLGEIIYRFCFGSLYQYRLFNGDPHPGNYLILDDGSVAFVDYGCVADFSGNGRRLQGAYSRAARGGPRSRANGNGSDRHPSRRAPFKTEQLYEHMHWYWAPILGGGSHVHPSSPPKWCDANADRRTRRRTDRHCNVPEGMVFLTRINFGLAGLFAALDAQGPWRDIVREYVEGAAPCTELGRLSAATSRGASV